MRCALLALVLTSHFDWLQSTLLGLYLNAQVYYQTIYVGKSISKLQMDIELKK
jgi:hypothetical protein